MASLTVARGSWRSDVFVYHPDGTIDIDGCPKTVFPPTDLRSVAVQIERAPCRDITCDGQQGEGSNDHAGSRSDLDR